MEETCSLISSIQPQYFSYSLSWFNQETSVKEVVGLRSTAKSPVVEDEAVLQLLSMESGIIMGLPS